MGRDDGPGPVDVEESVAARLRPLALHEVTLREGFWRERQDVNAAVNLPSGWDELESAGALRNFRIAAGDVPGSFTGPPFHDSDVYKWLEAAAWRLGSGADPSLSERVAEAVDVLRRAQEPDGYLDTHVQVAAPDRRWRDLAYSHELYCAGHLIQAAVASCRATGDGELLEVARRFADLLASVFGPDGLQRLDGHPEVETALVELFRLTRDRRYLDLAAFFVDNRGRGWQGPGRHGGPAYFQDHVPVREATEMAGHAVRQLYLLCGVVDLFLETGDRPLLDAAERQWEGMTGSMLYLTGGVGSQHSGEAFGEPYELGNDSAYAETCAAIASVMLAWRLLLATGRARYADLIERTLYNGFLSGVSLDGGRYFYVNPLLARAAPPELGRKRVEREPWHDCACCPPNVMRLLASLQHYLVTRDARGVHVQQYAPMTVSATLPGGQGVAFEVSTRYPWDGDVVVRVSSSGSWGLGLRIPAWCTSAEFAINGTAVEPRRSDGYAVLEREWAPGDEVSCRFAMPPRLTEAHPRVDAARGCVAVERGPLVYCFEEADGVAVLDAELDPAEPLEDRWRPDLLGGVTEVEAGGTVACEDGSGPAPLYAPFGSGAAGSRRPVRMRAIPYWAWANRGPSAMRVWMPRSGVHG